MSSANLDLVRSIYAAWERGDYSSADWAHPKVKLVRPDGPAPGTWEGLEGLAEAARDFLSTWEGFRFEADEFRELDDDRVLVLTRRKGRGKTSGLELWEIGTDGAAVVQIRDGRVTRLVFYFDRERALADLGFAPETGSRGSQSAAGSAGETPPSHESSSRRRACHCRVADMFRVCVE
jgi:ketosteroid isomerase-like protein